MTGLTVEEEQIMKRKNIRATALIDGRYIDPHKTGFVDSVALCDAIKAFYPHPQDGGLGILDWEDQNFETLLLKKGESAFEFDKALQNFITMLRIARRLRPAVKWGIYNIPYTDYWHRNETWEKQGDRLAPLLAMQDVLMPSLYDFYKKGTRYTDDEAYFKENTKLALQLGKEYNKPVYAFIWHRYHESDPIIGLELIPEPEFTEDIEYIMSVNYKGVTVSGLVWFDAPAYFYRVKKSLKTKDVNITGGSPENVLEKVLNKYSAIIKQQVEKVRGIQQ